MRALAALLGVVAIAQAMAPRATPPATGTVSGVVVESATGAPVAGAVVTLGSSVRPDPARQDRQVTDRQGRFVFTDVAASAGLQVTASKPGFIAEDPAPAFGRAQLNRVTIAEGEWVNNVRIVMSRLGSIGGEVTDETGEPLVGVTVRVLADVRVAGHARLAGGPIVRTDDRGRYRVANLLPGRYLVAVPSVQASVPAGTRVTNASARITGNPTAGEVTLGNTTRVLLSAYPVPPPPVDGRMLAYATTFHPGARSVAEASRIDLGAGEHRSGVAVRLAPLHVVDVTGHVEGPPDIVNGLSLRLLANGLEDLGLGMETATAMAGPDGSFRFTGIPAASYVIEVPGAVAELQFSRLTGFLTPPAAPPGSSLSTTYMDAVAAGPPGTLLLETQVRGARPAGGRTPVVVGDSDVTGLVLRLLPMTRLAGRVQFEFDPRTETPPTAPNVQIRLEPADGDPGLGLPRTSTGREDSRRPFEFRQLTPGRYFVRVQQGLNFQVKQVTIAGRDHTDVPIDVAGSAGIENVVVTLTNVPTLVSGSVRAGRGAVAAHVRVVAFPAERSRWTDNGLTPPGLASALSNNEGGFEISGLPAGDYYVVALPYAPLMDWRSPEFFERAAGLARRVQVRWGQTARQDLDLSETLR